MALLDVDELMTDPDLVDEVTQIKRVSRADNFGQNVITEVCIQTVGSIQPASGAVLQRLPDFLRNSSVKSFWLKGIITATSPGKYTDILVSNGQRYQVQHIFDWSNWGEGFTEGVCVDEVPA